MTVISYAQNYEDIMLWRALRHVSSGCYVDVGANDPVIDSVTCWFYEQGWSGINIEPVTHWFEKLQAARPRDINLQTAVTDRVGPLTLYDIPGTGLATLDPAVAETHRQSGCEVLETMVQTQALDALLRLHMSGREIHFLKIDVEGAEREVLLSIHLTEFRPWIILVEATESRSPVANHDLWEDLLLDRGYQFAYFDGLNRFYVAEEHADLLPALHVPPNTFDGFMRYAEWQIRSDNHQLRQQLASLRHDGECREIQLQELQQAQKQVQRLQGQDEQKEEARVWRQRVQAIESSTSWRVTAPLRALRAALGGVDASPASDTSQVMTDPLASPVSAAAPVTDAAAEKPPESGPVAPVGLDATNLLLHQISSHWRLVDHMRSEQPMPQAFCCALCGHTAETANFKTFESQCRFGGGRLLRHQCPACDVIFGPAKMLGLNPQELADEYDWHYRIFTEGDSTEQEIRAFFALEPEPGGTYLNYGAGAWSQSVQQLRQQGWDISAYEPTQSAQQRPGLITRPEDLAAMRFDGIYSNNVLEHLRHPVQELRQLANLLKPGGRMSHATPCFEYLYEYTRFHLFFYLGRSRHYLADQAGLAICHSTADGHYMNTVYQPSAT